MRRGAGQVRPEDYRTPQHDTQTALERPMLLIFLAAVIVVPVADVSEPTTDITEWTFRARVTNFRIVPLNEIARVGVVYTESAIKEAKNGATLVVGIDAHWLVTLAILDHGNDPLGFKHIKTLRLVIHSPAVSLEVDKPNNREFDLALSYKVNGRSEYSFVRLQARQLPKSK